VVAHISCPVFSLFLGLKTCRCRENAYFYVDFAQCKTHYIRLLYFAVKINGIVYTDNLFKDEESGIITIALLEQFLHIFGQAFNYLGVDGAWWLSWSSKPVAGRRSRPR